MESVTSVVLIVLTVYILMQRQKGRGQAAASTAVELVKGERFRPLRMQQIEPLLELTIVGTVLWLDLTRGDWHIVAALIGVVPGIAFGVYRAKLMYVRSYGELQGVVLRRSVSEYVALALLLVVKLLAEDPKLLPNTGWLSLVITGLLALIVAESAARAFMVSRWYHRDTVAKP